jgi:hypothetical protein
MASNTAPVVDRIRIIPRPDDFLDRNVGSSGEVFYDKQANTLRLYSGKQAGGFSLLTAGNLSQQLADAGVALLEKTVTVGVDTVNGQASGVFYIDGVEKPQLEFVRGYTYLFDQSDETNNSFANLWHPLMFATTPNGDLIEGGAHYNPGIVYLLDDDPVSMRYYTDNFQSATTKKVLFTVKSSAPDTLYYWCHFHTNQGNEITVSDPGTGTGTGGGASVEVSDTAPTAPTQGTIWFDSSNGKIFVYVTDEDSSQWVQPTVPLPPVNTFKNISVTGGSTLVASGNADTVNFAPGSNITLSVDPATNTITINSSGGGGSSYDQNLNTTDDVTFDDITATGILTASSINAAAIQNTGVGNPTFTSASTIDFIAPDGIRLENVLKTNEVLTNIAGATGTVTFNYSAGPIFNVTTPAANWTADITNVPTTDNRATNTAIIITQGTTPYVPTVIQIAGVTQTINWIDNVAPSGNANKTDVITLSMLRVGGSWNVLGSYVNYG